MHGGASSCGVMQFDASVEFDEQFRDVIRASLAGHQQSRVIVRVTRVWVSAGLKQHLQIRHGKACATQTKTTRQLTSGSNFV